MGVTLVTGATGFIGSHVARALAERGDELRILARRSSSLDLLKGVELDRVTGDVTDRRAVRRAVAGVERIFHVAGRTSLRERDRAAVWEANLRGARIVFEEALAVGVERVIHTSTVGAIGVARPGGAIDETATFDIGHLGIAYVNSKHEAELEALRAASRGLPVVIVNPSFAFGPDAPRGTSMDLVRRFLLRRIPAYVDGALNIVDVRDVAAGHLLADAKGQPGERYILAGRNFTLDRLFADLARISGLEPPSLKLPGRVMLSALEAGSRVRIPLPSSRDEVRSAMHWWTYRNGRAKRELGFSPRPHEETLTDAVRWQAAQLGDRVGAGGGPEQTVIDALGRAIKLGGRVTRRLS
jgi:dihydroflavonol-4-reductase